MKIYKIINIAMLFLCADCIAQNTDIEITNYIIDDTKVFEVVGYVPGSDILFYSEKGGGKMLESVTTSEHDIQLTHIVSKENAPSFLLNANRENTNGIAGSGKVSFVGKPDFLFKNLKLNDVVTGRELTWDASFFDAENYRFDIVGIQKNGSRNMLATIPCHISENVEHYQYADFDNKGAGYEYYEIKIIEGDNIRYSAKKFLNTSNDIEVFPTIVKTSFTLQLPSTTNSSSYSIINSHGQVVQEGMLKSKRCIIEVVNLPSGTYYVDVNKLGDGAKFVKL